LFRHCDNSNNAGLTGTVHEGMKACGGTRRSLPPATVLHPPVSFATSKQASRVSSRCVPVGTLALCAGLFAVPPTPSVSFHLSLFHTNTTTRIVPGLTMLFQALRATTAYARSRTRKASLLSETKNWFIDKRNRAAGYIFS